MAPIKLEDHIREQFEEREITPSAGAWDKLESKLVSQKSKKRPAYIWYAIAASIIGMLFIASQFFYAEDEQMPLELVEIDAESPSENEIITSEILNTETQLAKENIVIEKKETPILNKEKLNAPIATIKNNKSPMIQKKAINLTNKKDIRVAAQVKGKSPSQNISEVINNEIVFKSKVDEVVAAVNKIQQERKTVSAAEIDALLLTAQRNLATERILNETKIDATALLNDVEFELEKSFRDKVFDALGDSFSKIRTAVVERNN